MDDWEENYDEDAEEEGLTLAINEKGELEEFKEDDWVSVKKTDMVLIQAYIEANQEAFTAFCKERTQ
jgi:hypothetical protein